MAAPASLPSPKAFISYSWSSAEHQARIIGWAQRLAGDGVTVVMDKFDLREGDDKNAFMESMITDPTVTHVLIFTDKMYVEKADSRKAGVGTESQIISQEVYAKVKQSKFIPIFCEVSETGEPRFPVFLKSRIGIDFSSDEAVNRNWEQLIRLLYGRPLLEKPVPGKAPAYITEESTPPAGSFVGKFSVLRQAMVHGQRDLKSYRRDFLDSVIAQADLLRRRTQPDLSKFPEQVVDTFRQLVPLRNAIVNWVLLEAEAKSDGFEESLMEFLERMLELKARPKEMNAWNDAWAGGHVAFVYESFLYIIAALIKVGSFQVLNSLLFGSYLLPEHSRSGQDKFGKFDEFYGYVEGINKVLDEKLQYYSQMVELVKRHADRSDLTFESFIEADAVCLLASALQNDTEWYPQTFYYLGYGRSLMFFTRLAQHRHFANLLIMTGMSAPALRAQMTDGMARLKSNEWGRFNTVPMTVLNFEKWDSLR